MKEQEEAERIRIRKILALYKELEIRLDLILADLGIKDRKHKN
jgi:hypothetical protein